jgi:hypothetical protein
MLGRGVSTIYEFIADGKIRAVKSDGRTLVVVVSLHEYVASLPSAKIARRPKRKPQHLREKETPAPPPPAPKPEVPKQAARKRPPRISMWDAIDKQRKQEPRR